jgi:hypothetical protein
MHKAIFKFNCIFQVSGGILSKNGNKGKDYPPLSSKGNAYKGF